ncbi:hypothetical protein Poli38472_006272 [Pythium oligandrum]|uniref:PX domain-containing protein n=1 Tax=Pythium oligandrum TaxID=41045 RepID=A0A8K1FPX1_PYTOL|nr:hypothetical protein Poli38472_006272 [Pythium oligandrum]|eukprot:TMW68804.1 hypothetical protein Poli38472_006272 [Pythium oligandrum]
MTMALDVLKPSPLKLHVRAARQPEGQTQPQYEILCRATIPKADGPRRHDVSTLMFNDPSSTVEWSIWKSYEDFHTFDLQMRVRPSTFAKVMVTVAFAPSHKVRALFHQDQSARFFEKRRKELDYYLQRILLLSDVGDFVSGNGSSILAEFIRAGDHIPNLRLSNASTADSSHGLRQLHVDLRSTYSPPPPKEYDVPAKTRKECKQEIEDELVARGGENAFKLFRKRAKTFRKENDSLHAATEFVAFVNSQYDREFAMWLLTRFYHSLRNEEQRAALSAAGGLREEEQVARRSEKLRRRSVDMLPMSPLATHKPTSKELLAKVEKLAAGDKQRVAAFKRAAKSLGKEEMSTPEFVQFLLSTFGERDGRRILKMAAEVVPSQRLQQELRAAVAP